MWVLLYPPPCWLIQHFPDNEEREERKNSMMTFVNWWHKSFGLPVSGYFKNTFQISLNSYSDCSLTNKDQFCNREPRDCRRCTLALCRKYNRRVQVLGFISQVPGDLAPTFPVIDFKSRVTSRPNGSRSYYYLEFGHYRYRCQVRGNQLVDFGETNFLRCVRTMLGCLVLEKEVRNQIEVRLGQVIVLPPSSIKVCIRIVCQKLNFRENQYSTQRLHSEMIYDTTYKMF